MWIISYGGAVITNVGYNIPNVTGLVYVVGFALIRDNLLAYFVDVSKLPMIY